MLAFQHEGEKKNKIDSITLKWRDAGAHCELARCIASSKYNIVSNFSPELKGERISSYIFKINSSERWFNPVFAKPQPLQTVLHRDGFYKHERDRTFRIQI